jgi:hypothetical protein
MRKILFSIIALAIIAGSASAAPVISNIQTTPEIAVQNQDVNITANITGTLPILFAEICFPSLGISYPMMNGSGTIHYYNKSYFATGNYLFYVHAVDNGGNHANSTTHQFQILYKGAATVTDIIKVYVPEQLGVFNHTKIVVVLNDAFTGLPKSGMKSNISCYVMKPDGTMKVSGAHPYELSAGIYAINFTTTQELGTYFAWAEVNYSGIIFKDEDSLQVIWDMYDNMTMLTLRMADVIGITQWEAQNITREVVSHISARDTQISDIKGDTESFGFLGAASDVVLGTIFQWIFTALLLLIVFVIATWIYGRGKAIRIARRVANLPGELVERVGGD